MTSGKLIELATFTPMEAQTITGVSSATQRDWRRRELTSHKTRKGWTRFTTEDLIHLLVLRQLMPQVRPRRAYLIARMAVQATIGILAERTFGGVSVKLADDPTMIVDWASLRGRYVVQSESAAGSLKTILVSDLNSLSKGAKAISEPQTADDRKSERILSYIVVDLADVAEELQARQLKPYFVEQSRKARTQPRKQSHG